MYSQGLQTQAALTDFEFTGHLQCWETLLSPAGVVEATMVVAVEWEPSAFDSFEDTGLRVERGVTGSGAPEGAVVRWGMASAWDTPPEGGGKSSATVVPGVNPAGGEDVGVTSFLGAPAKEGGVQQEALAQEMEVL